MLAELASHRGVRAACALSGQELTLGIVLQMHKGFRTQCIPCYIADWARAIPVTQLGAKLLQAAVSWKMTMNLLAVGYSGPLQQRCCR